MAAKGLVWDEPALERFLEAVAGGVDDWAQEDAVPGVVAAAPKRRGRYRRTIHAATFFRNRLIGGRPVRGGRVKSKAEIWTLIYTTSPLGHLLEHGTQAHRIRFHSQVVMGAEKFEGLIDHPGSRSFPHFAPGILSTRGRIALTVRKGIQQRLGRR
jgi:hypothetical protein